MRFVAADTVRVTLANGDWIEIKKELTIGEDRAFRAAGFKRVVPGVSGLDVDWAAMAIARVETYLVDWSARDAKDKAIPVTPDAIRALAIEDFEAIDSAIQAHIAARDEEKKLTTTTPTSSAA